MPTVIGSTKEEFDRKFMEQRGQVAPEKKNKKQKYTEHGLAINEKGHVRLWHGTSKESAEKIIKDKKMTSKGEPDIYFTTHPKEAGYGKSFVGVDIPHHLIELDDEFPSGRMDFKVHAPKKELDVVNPAIEESSYESK